MYWEDEVARAQPGSEIQIPNLGGNALLAAGYYRSSGLPVGQLADFRRALPDGRGIHVRIYNNRTTAHLDRCDPSVSLIGHLVQDAPGFTLFAVVGIVALVGALSS